MKKLIILSFILAGAMTTLAQTARHSPKNKADSVVRTVYTCTMHPEVIRAKPGKCPKCGMVLVKKKPPTTAK